MNRTAWFSVIAAVLVAAASAAWYWRTQQPVPDTAPAQSSAPPAPAPAPPPPAASTPTIQHPLPEPAADQPSLEAAADPNAALRDLLASVIGSDALARFVPTDEIARRFVATVDNLPRETLPMQVRALKATGGSFEVLEADGNLSIAPANASRYVPLVRMLESVDPARAAAAYIRAYPLLQAQYRALGYPDRYLNDRVVEAIDDLLAAPVPTEPPRLVQPKVLYQYADPAVETASAGRKAMMRVGPDNAARIKARLRSLRAAITRSPPPR